jgi:hypothetical protein
MILMVRNEERFFIPGRSRRASTGVFHSNQPFFALFGFVATVRLSCLGYDLARFIDADQTLRQELFDHMRDRRDILAVIFPRST